MTPFSKQLGILIGLLALAGCGPKTHYSWNGYDDALYQHYKDPAQYEHFVEALKEVVDEGDASGKIPPGMYAEYGYALYEQGKISDAIVYFKKESDKWPESKFFMAKVTAIAQNRTKKPADQTQKGDTLPKGDEAAPVEVKQ
jgi:hypothetical protein